LEGPSCGSATPMATGALAPGLSSATLGRHEADAARALDEGCPPQPTALPDTGPISRGPPRVPALVACLQSVGISPTRDRPGGARGRELRDCRRRGDLSRWAALRDATLGPDAGPQAARGRLCA